MAVVIEKFGLKRKWTRTGKFTEIRTGLCPIISGYLRKVGNSRTLSPLHAPIDTSLFHLPGIRRGAKTAVKLKLKQT